VDHVEKNRQNIVKCHHMLRHTVTCRHIQSHAITYSQMILSHAITYSHMPSHTVT